MPDQSHAKGRSIASLRLNLAAATDGRCWEILPEGFRDAGKTYPLPSSYADLQRLAAIPIPPGKFGSDATYLKRALAEYKRRAGRRTSAATDITRKTWKIEKADQRFRERLDEMKVEAQAAVDGVKVQAAEAIASLTDLFALGRKGLEAQMKAHLAGEKLHDEDINAAAFRDCFRMVTQAVKGLGLPSDQRERAQEAIMQEAADALESTREAVAMAGSPEGEVN
jgi:hypothetical protein